MKAYSDKLRDRVLKAYKSPSGTIKSIAQRFDVSVASVNTWARVAGISRGVRRTEKEKKGQK
jgi:transposase